MREESKFNFQNYTIPEHMRDGIDRYVTHHIEPGRFLRAVFENDFVRVCGQADSLNLRNLPAYANYLYNHVPISCWGSREIVNAWLKKGA